jgi:hypothetical protein
MDMRIDNARHYRSTCGIDDNSFIRNLEVSRLPNGDNAIAIDSDKAGPRSDLG